MSSYLVVGMQKSGTSAIYSMLKSALGPARRAFEPGSRRQIESLLSSRDSSKLAKTLYRGFMNDIDALNGFDYKVHIVRDARDIVISYLLYWPLLRNRHLNDHFIDDFVELLEEKEAQPDAVSLKDFARLTEKHDARFMKPRDFGILGGLAVKFHENLSDAFTLKYDALLSGELEDLEGYLNLSLPRSTKVSSHISYNERQKSSGTWRNWFTPKDVADYRPILSGYLDHFGFDPDWTLNESPQIESKHGSIYIRKSVSKLTEFPAPNGELRAKELYTDDYHAHLQSARSDGIESAMIELALAHLAGFGVEKDPAAYQELLWEAYERGNVMAMIHIYVASRIGIISLPGDLSPNDIAREAGRQLGAKTLGRRTQRVEAFYEANFRSGTD